MKWVAEIVKKHSAVGTQDEICFIQQMITKRTVIGFVCWSLQWKTCIHYILKFVRELSSHRCIGNYQYVKELAIIIHFWIQDISAPVKIDGKFDLKLIPEFHRSTTEPSVVEWVEKAELVWKMYGMSTFSPLRLTVRKFDVNSDTWKN